MDELQLKKKRSKIRKFTHLFVYIDKAIHAESLQNKRINISFSLHPGIFPIVSPSAFVQFNHVRFLFGFSVPIESLIFGGLNSLTDLQIQITIRESSTVKILGNCFIPLQSNLTTAKKSILTKTETNLKNITDIDKAMIEFCKGFNNDSPNFIYQNTKFPVFEPGKSKIINEKSKICDLILTLALGNENHGKIIIPTKIVNQQIFFKDASSSPARKSPIKHIRTTYSDSSQKRLRKKTILPSSKLSTDQIQFVIRNWKSYAIRNGWTPPDTSEGYESTAKEEPIKKDIVLDKKGKKKFTGLLNRKLIKIGEESEDTPSVYSEKEKNAENSSNTSISSIFLSQAVDKEEIHQPKQEKKTREKKNRRFLKKIDSSSSIGPQRTTQYQIITQFSLNDSFPDKLQRGIFSDPPRHPDLMLIDKSNEKEHSSSDKSSSISIYDDLINNSSLSLSQTPLEELNDITISEIAAMRKTNDQSPFISPNFNEGFHSIKQEIYSNSSKANNERHINSSKTKEDLHFDMNIEQKKRITKSNSDFVSSEKEGSGFEFEINVGKSSADKQYSENFNRLDELISYPKIVEPKKLTINHFNDIASIEPKIKFGEKEIVYVRVFGTRPNPSQRINVRYIKPKRKSVNNQSFNSIDEDNSQIDTSKEIKKSPSLEKLLEEGMLELDLNLSDSSDS